MLRILVADDEPSIRLTLADSLAAGRHQVVTAEDGEQALSQLQSQRFDLVISDIRMPKVDGLEVFRTVRECHPQTDVILMTAYGDVSEAVSAMKEGAYDYLTKPFDYDEIGVRLERLAERRQLTRELEEARVALSQQGSSALIVGNSEPMQRLLTRIDTIAPSDVSVVITGESGTGKELVAKALHHGSARRDHAFVAVNCAAFPETLIEAELFGHERGAFTGAMRRRDGRFKAADKGTLFLDEIGEIPPMVQAKLLRVLQEGAIEPLGTNTPVPVDVRVICATHRNLKQLIAEEKFREDLYYRLNVIDIMVPPLRDRRSDLPVLVEHFMRRCVRDPIDVPPVSPRAWAALSEYPFPGNVRELEHAVQHAVVLAAGGEIDLQHLPSDIAGATAPLSTSGNGAFRPLAVAMKEFERQYLLRALNLSYGKKARTAESLGISRKNLWEKMRAHGISDSEIHEEAVVA